MRVLIDLLHPAHVHFFRPLVGELRARGHEVRLMSRHKDVTVDLLDRFGMEHTVLSRLKPGVGALALEMGVRCLKLGRQVAIWHPHVMLGIMGPAIAVTGKLFPGARTIAFYDNESARLVNRVVYRLADLYCTPEAYEEDAGPHQVRYRGYHELAYLHPNRFTPDPEVPRRYGLGEGPLFLLRFVAWESIHDVGETGLSLDLKREVLRRLSERGRVVISSERPLPPEFEPYRLRIDPIDIHHILWRASLVVGESSTMASEAACLGTHAFFVSKTGRGVNKEQEQRYGLVHNFGARQDRAVLARLEALLSLPDLVADGRERGKRLIEENIDVTAWMLDLVEREGTAGAGREG